MPSFIVETALTPLTITSDGHAVTRIRFGLHTRRCPESRFEASVTDELRHYLDGSRRDFSFAIRPRGTPFQTRVWRALCRIPYGGRVTYGELARSIDQPRASRAVGMANNRNPIPIVIPCHRVVAAGGKLGGYGGGVRIKQALLDLETNLTVETI